MIHIVVWQSLIIFFTALLWILWVSTVAIKDEAVTTDVAWSFYDRLLEDERIYFMREPDGLEQAWREYTRNRGYSHRIWNDAYLTAFARGSPPVSLSSMSSPAFNPEPLPQQNVFSRMVFSGIS